MQKVTFFLDSDMWNLSTELEKTHHFLKQQCFVIDDNKINQFLLSLSNGIKIEISPK